MMFYIVFAAVAIVVNGHHEDVSRIHLLIYIFNIGIT